MSFPRLISSRRHPQVVDLKKGPEKEPQYNITPFSGLQSTLQTKFKGEEAERWVTGLLEFELGSEHDPLSAQIKDREPSTELRDREISDESNKLKKVTAEEVIVHIMNAKYLAGCESKSCKTTPTLKDIECLKTVIYPGDATYFNGLPGLEMYKAFFMGWKTHAHPALPVWNKWRETGQLSEEALQYFYRRLGNGNKGRGESLLDGAVNDWKQEDIDRWVALYSDSE